MTTYRALAVWVVGFYLTAFGYAFLGRGQNFEALMAGIGAVGCVIAFAGTALRRGEP